MVHAIADNEFYKTWEKVKSKWSLFRLILIFLTTLLLNTYLNAAFLAILENYFLLFAWLKLTFCFISILGWTIFSHFYNISLNLTCYKSIYNIFYGLFLLLSIYCTTFVPFIDTTQLFFTFCKSSRRSHSSANPKLRKGGIILLKYLAVLWSVCMISISVCHWLHGLGQYESQKN